LGATLKQIFEQEPPLYAKPKTNSPQLQHTHAAKPHQNSINVNAGQTNATSNFVSQSSKPMSPQRGGQTPSGSLPSIFISQSGTLAQTQSPFNYNQPERQTQTLPRANQPVATNYQAQTLPPSPYSMTVGLQVCHPDKNPKLPTPVDVQADAQLMGLHQRGQLLELLRKEADGMMRRLPVEIDKLLNLNRQLLANQEKFQAQSSMYTQVKVPCV
jgi:hypothetical protein